MTSAIDQAIDARLLRRLQRGEASAWAALVNTWAPRLHAYLSYILPDPHAAQSVVQDVFVAAVRSLPTLDSGVAHSTWLYALAQHKAADAWRTSRSNGASAANPSQADRHSPLQLALATLPDQTRHALLLHYREGLSIAEVADVLGRTYRATEALIERGTSLLRASLNTELVDHA